MFLLFLGAALILLGFLMLSWPRRGQKDYAHDARNQNLSREHQDHELWRQRPEKRETRENSKESDETEQHHVKGGAVVIIGPIPIVMGSDPMIALVMMLIALAIMILMALTVKWN